MSLWNLFQINGLRKTITNWVSFFLSFFQASEGNVDGLLIPLEKATLTMKVLRKSIIHGMRKPHENADVLLFLNTLLEQARLVLNFRKSTNKNIQMGVTKPSPALDYVNRVLHS